MNVKIQWEMRVDSFGAATPVNGEDLMLNERQIHGGKKSR